MNDTLRWPALLMLTVCLSACIEPRTTLRPIRRSNDVVGTHGSSVSTAGSSSAASYTVQGGDTLFRIAFRFQTTVDELVQWNGIVDRNRIQVGQRLQVGPVSVASSVRPSSTGPALATTSAATRPPLPAMDPGEPAQRGVPADALPASTAPGDQGGGVVTAGVRDDSIVSAGVVSSRPYRDPQPATAPITTAATRPALPAIDPEATLAPPSTATSVPPAGGGNTTTTGPAITSIAAPNAVRNGWSWPAAGRLVGTFVAADATRSGIDIAGTEGQAVHAASDGEVVYSGTGIIGYGELIVIQHPSGLLSAYGHNRKRLVTEGAKIKRGQQIAELGRDASGRQLLHFEVRKSGKPVDPLAYLPGK